MRLESELTYFEGISLEQMDRVTLMNRIDTKYVLSYEVLFRLLTDILQEYFILEIDSKRIFPYRSLYFDTSANNLFNSHHNGKLNRFKIRFREYVQSNTTYLEVKKKIKGTRTIKNRILVNQIENNLSDNSKKFINEVAPGINYNLYSKLYTNFNRITLVSKNFSERATIDTNICFYTNKDDQVALDNCVILELKRDGSKANSPLSQRLKHYGVYPSGLSKYCIGRALTQTGLKKNNFKEKILTLNKIEHGEYNFRNI